MSKKIFELYRGNGSDKRQTKNSVMHNKFLK
jgi:hypothetical protein